MRNMASSSDESGIAFIARWFFTTRDMVFYDDPKGLSLEVAKYGVRRRNMIAEPRQ